MTTGGITSGRWTMPSTIARPGKLTRASSQAMKMPNGRLPIIATVATRRLRWIASHSSGVSASNIGRADRVMGPELWLRRSMAPSRR